MSTETPKNENEKKKKKNHKNKMWYGGLGPRLGPFLLDGEWLFAETKANVIVDDDKKTRRWAELSYQSDLIMIVNNMTVTVMSVVKDRFSDRLLATDRIVAKEWFFWMKFRCELSLFSKSFFRLCSVLSRFYVVLVGT